MMFYILKNLLNKNRCYCEMKIDDAELHKLIEKGAILIDVRSLQEFKEGHLENSISMPVYEIERNCNEILKDKNQKIIVYCSSGYRSAKAQKILKKLGYREVYNLCDGLENYI